MEVSGIIIAFLGMTCWALSIFPFTKAGRLMSVMSMNLFRLIVGTILVMILASIVNLGNMLSVYSSSYLQGWLWLGLSGVVALGIGDYFNYRMYVILGARYGSVLATLSPASALLFGTILLHEHINLIGIIGMIITTVGVIGMSLGPTERNAIPDHGHGSIRAGILFGLISAICNGAGLAFSKKGFMVQSVIGNPISPITGSFMRFAVATLLVLLITLFNKQLLAHLRNIRNQLPSTLRIALTGTLLGPLLGVSCAMIAIQYIDVAVAQTIFALVPVMALTIAHFIYKEKLTPQAITGIIAALAGVFILIWRTSIAEWMGI